jgi:hypothetical protein
MPDASVLPRKINTAGGLKKKNVFFYAKNIESDKIYDYLEFK